MPTVTKVAIAIVESAGHVLVGTRPEGAPLAGTAEFPGGKCLPDETPRSCAVRECREETGLIVVPREFLLTTTHTYHHGTVELDFWRCSLSPDVQDLTPATQPFCWTPFRELRYLNFPAGNREVVNLLLERSSNRPCLDEELSRLVDKVSAAFADVTRPEHFTDHTHCDECGEHDRALQEVDGNDLQLRHLGTPGWDPINFVTDHAYRYLLPGLVRVMVRNPGQYFDRFLLHLRPQRLAALERSERAAVEEFLDAYRQRISRQTESHQGEWSILSPEPEPDSPIDDIDTRLRELRELVGN